MPDQDDEGDQAATRLERALDRIETLARRPGVVSATVPSGGPMPASPEAVSRIDALIAKLDAALVRDH